MSTLLTHTLLVAVPVGLTAILALFIWRGKPLHPPTYKMTDPWTHAPILWAAEEPADHGHGAGHHDDHVTVGGGASGKW
ncbi:MULTISPECIES: hypothetical protein [Mycobacteriaceae]|uniref:aa3-type cytochrome oxidase subunit CtaJ n=1 Tax=Mycobacteriaceae TaxID=1762 RepID=UPI0009ED2ABE|nr:MULTISPECIES: hypothetical protein [Mycobacteriaceae]MCK0176677.1 hypothetical protein [Mycolicibacterium sp. F2034L]